MSTISELFHDTQITTGNTIVETFTTGAAPYVILWALCQSGKSGTFHWVARRMLELGRCKRVYILCGSAEVCLRDQAKLDAATYNGKSYADRNLQVIFRQDFKKSDMIIKDSLIIIDESHLDQTKGMQLDKFLQAHGLNLTGNCPYAIENNCNILSVSATPYAEIAALKDAERKGEAVQKSIVHLTPGEGYVGIEKFLEAKRIHPTFNLSSKTSHEFARFMKNPDFHCKYNIMRVKNRQAAKTVRDAKKLGGYTVLDYTAKATNIFITKAERDAHVDEIVKSKLRTCSKRNRLDKDYERKQRRLARQQNPWLGSAPDQTIVILIKDRLRAGKVVPKQHIGFVWEDATTSKTDTLVQALLGRMCGYYEPGQYLPQIFLPSTVIERHEGCVMAQSELERAIDMRMLPREFSHSTAHRLTKTPSHGKVQTVPIKFKLSGAWCEEKEPALRDNDLLMRAIVKLRRLFDRNSSCLPAFTEDQRAQIQALLDQDEEVLVKRSKEAARVAQRNLHSTSHPHWWPKLAEATATATSMHGLGDEIVGAPPLALAFVYDNYTLASAEDKGCVYAIFYLDVPVTLETLSPRLLFGATDELELYSAGDAPLPTIWSSSITAFTGRMSRLCLEDAESFAAFFSKLLVNDLAVTELSDEERGYFPFRRSAYEFKTKEDNELTRLCNKLGSEVGMSVHIDFKPGLVRETFRVRKISWKPASA